MIVGEDTEKVPLLYMRRSRTEGACCLKNSCQCLTTFAVILVVAVGCAVLLTIYFGPSCQACWQTGPMMGIVLLQSDNGSNLRGALTLNQGNSTKPLEITGMISGLEPKSICSLTVQPNGNLTGGCLSAFGIPDGAGINVSSKTVKLQYADPFRDIASFGSHWPEFSADASGSLDVYIMDSSLSLCGEHSIVGRSIVISVIGPDFTSAPVGCGLVGYIPI